MHISLIYAYFYIISASMHNYSFFMHIPSLFLLNCTLLLIFAPRFLLISWTSFRIWRLEPKVFIVIIRMIRKTFLSHPVNVSGYNLFPARHGSRGEKSAGYNMTLISPKGQDASRGMSFQRALPSHIQNETDLHFYNAPPFTLWSKVKLVGFYSFIFAILVTH